MLVLTIPVFSHIPRAPHGLRGGGGHQQTWRAGILSFHETVRHHWISIHEIRKSNEHAVISYSLTGLSTTIHFQKKWEREASDVHCGQLAKRKTIRTISLWPDTNKKQHWLRTTNKHNQSSHSKITTLSYELRNWAEDTVSLRQRSDLFHENGS